MARSPVPVAVTVTVAMTVWAGCLDEGGPGWSSHAEVLDPAVPLHIVVHAQPGLQLDQQAFDDWLAVVREVRGGEVLVSEGSALRADDSSSFDELFDLAEVLWEQSPAWDEDTVHLPLMLVHRSDPEGLAGITGSETWVGGRRVFTAIFMDTIHDATYFPLQEPLPLPFPPPSPLPGPEQLMQVQRAVLVHEFGHAVGLVGCGIPEVRSHYSPEARCHSRNEESVMWFVVRSSQDLQKYILEDRFGPNWRFDADDLADIRAAQETLANGGSLREDRGR